MANGDNFGFEPEDLDRFVRGAGEQLRGAFAQFGNLVQGSGGKSPWSSVFDDARQRRTAPTPTTAGEAGDGVWVIYAVGADGGARVEEVYATELDALRANQHNTESTRRVRFLPYGIAISVLDAEQE